MYIVSSVDRQDSEYSLSDPTHAGMTESNKAAATQPVTYRSIIFNQHNMTKHSLKIPSFFKVLEYKYEYHKYE